MSKDGPDPASPRAAAEDEGDDYMNMVFAEAPSAPETSLQRRQRLKREAEERGRIKSKAELAAEEVAKREAALRTSLLVGDPTGGNGAHAGAPFRKSKGFAMMAKMGFKAGSALGPRPQQQQQAPSSPSGLAAAADGICITDISRGEDQGGVPRTDSRLLEPVPISIKEDRGGIGLDSERKRKAREAAEGLGQDGFKRPKPVDPGEFRDRVRMEREVARKERQLHAAQLVAERMNEEEEEEENGEEDGNVRYHESEESEEEHKRRSKMKRKRKGKRMKLASSNQPLKYINLLWRGLVRAREESERDRRMRHDLQQSFPTLSSRLPAYDDASEDEDDKRALGREKVVYEAADDLDDEDPELDEFNALDVDLRLQKVVDHLRERHRYCFWCKFKYPDEEMEGCPGATEEDHD